MKILISALNVEQLRKVYKANDRLQNEVIEDYQESESMWIGEHLAYMKESVRDYSIGGRGDYISVSKPEQFIQDVKKADESIVGYLPQDYNLFTKGEALIEKLRNLDEDSYNTYDDYIDDCDRIEEEIEELATEIADDLVRAYRNQINSTYEYAEDYFVEFYSDSRLNECTYVNANEDGIIADYTLYEDVSYTKSYGGNN